MIGKTISHFNVLEKLGEGGMGQVFLALDTDLDRRVGKRRAVSALHDRVDGSLEVVRDILLKKSDASIGRELDRAMVRLEITMKQSQQSGFSRAISS